jgi:hypothetical protein
MDVAVTFIISRAKNVGGNKSSITSNRNFTATNNKSGLTDVIPLDAVIVPM